MEAVTRDAGADETTGTVTNALVGAAVTVLSATVVPLAPLLGGGVAGYLQAGEAGDGLRIGALAGVVAVPVLLALVALLVLPIYRTLGGTTGLGGLAVLVAAGTGYVVGLSTVGGHVGRRVADNRRHSRR